MNDQEKEKANKQWHDLKNSLLLVSNYLESMIMLGGRSIMVSCCLKRKLAICFWTGGLVLRTRLDGMSIRHIR